MYMYTFKYDLLARVVARDALFAPREQAVN